ncbi:hypothetical protein niasHT_017595 [Heterodera trifolii]|uniref:Uncharacterized protein n=1 Tax=Heterodera trifolii TaxID=157864 RepID=A0ABD2KZ28_9BILA
MLKLFLLKILKCRTPFALHSFKWVPSTNPVANCLQRMCGFHVCLQMKMKPFTAGGSNLTKIGQSLGAQIVVSLCLLFNLPLAFGSSSLRPCQIPSTPFSAVLLLLPSFSVPCLLSYWTTVLPSNATLFCLLLNIIFVFSAVVEHKLLNIGMRRRGNLQGSSMFTAKNMNEWIWQKFNRLLYLLGLYPDDTNQNA